jgi:hypothetical protein
MTAIKDGQVVEVDGTNWRGERQQKALWWVWWWRYQPAFDEAQLDILPLGV